MLKAYKYRLYPTDEQKVLFAKTFGCCRFVYNWGLSLKISAYKEKKETLSNIYITNLMRSELTIFTECIAQFRRCIFKVFPKFEGGRFSEI